MKILEMIATLGPGGAETLVCDLSRELSLKGEDVKIFLIAGLRGERGDLLQKRLVDAGVEIIGQPPRNPRSLKNLFHLRRILNSWQPDIVHCHLRSSEIALTVAQAFGANKACVSARTLHGTRFDQKGWNLALSRYVSNAFDYTIPCSISVEKAYKASKSYAERRRVVTIPNGCALPDRSDHQSTLDARKAFSIPPDSFVFCSIASFRGLSLGSSQKAHDVLLRAFAVAFKDKEQVLLVCAGDGPLRKEAESLAHVLGISKQVRFLGNIPDAWSLLKASDVFVMPSRWEGLPIALLEATATGLPAVASDIDEIQSLEGSGRWLLCPVDDQIAFSNMMVKVTLDYRKYLQLADEQGTVVRESYSMRLCSSRYRDLFASLTRKK